MSRSTPILLLAVLAILALPASALAKPHARNAHRTFPIATHLCKKVDKGHVPKKLEASVEQVKAACVTLRASHKESVTAFRTAVKPLRQQAREAIKALRATCRQARQDGDKAACKAARQEARKTVRGLRQQVRAAAKEYRSATKAARKTFWTTIHALRGGSDIKADTDDGPVPSSGVPSDTAVDQAAA